jgi:hypothetical protein
MVSVRKFLRVQFEVMTELLVHVAVVIATTEERAKPVAEGVEE